MGGSIGGKAHELRPLRAGKTQAQCPARRELHLEDGTGQRTGELLQLFSQQVVVLVQGKLALELCRFLQGRGKALQGARHGANFIVAILVGNLELVVVPAHALHAGGKTANRLRYVAQGNPGRTC